MSEAARNPAAAARRGILAPLLVWFAVLGGAGAWTAHTLTGWGLEEIICSPASRSVEVLGAPLVPVIGGVTAALAAVTLAALVVALTVWRRARNARPDASAGQPALEEPLEVVRMERLAFMGLVGFAANLLFLAIIVYGGIALIFFGPCSH
jgi:hypothetical protein